MSGYLGGQGTVVLRNLRRDSHEQCVCNEESVILLELMFGCKLYNRGVAKFSNESSKMYPLIGQKRKEPINNLLQDTATKYLLPRHSLYAPGTKWECSDLHIVTLCLSTLPEI